MHGCCMLHKCMYFTVYIDNNVIKMVGHPVDVRCWLFEKEKHRGRGKERERASESNTYKCVCGM